MHNTWMSRLACVALAIATTSSLAAPTQCSPAELATAKKATDKAREMLQKVDQLIANNDKIAVDRMDVWLGVKNSAQGKAVKERLSKAWAFLGGASFLCDKDDPAFAWVYGTDPFLIRLGSEFFKTGETGYSSRAGVLIHEATHFLIAGASKDPPKQALYGTDAALKRAKENPADAQVNAENLEYFVEATYFGMQPPVKK